MATCPSCHHAMAMRHGHDRAGRQLKGAKTRATSAHLRIAFSRPSNAPAFFVDVHSNNQEIADFLAASNATFGPSAAEADAALARTEALLGRIAVELARLSHFSGTVRTALRATRPGPAAGSLKPFAFPAALLELRTGPLPTRGGEYGSVLDQRRLGEALAQSVANGLAHG